VDLCSLKANILTLSFVCNPDCTVVRVSHLRLSLHVRLFAPTAVSGVQYNK